MDSEQERVKAGAAAMVAALAQVKAKRFDVEVGLAELARLGPADHPDRIRSRVAAWAAELAVASLLVDFLAGALERVDVTFVADLRMEARFQEALSALAPQIRAVFARAAARQS